MILSPFRELFRRVFSLLVFVFLPVYRFHLVFVVALPILLFSLLFFDLHFSRLVDINARMGSEDEDDDEDDGESSTASSDGTNEDSEDDSDTGDSRRVTIVRKRRKIIPRGLYITSLLYSHSRLFTSSHMMTDTIFFRWESACMNINFLASNSALFYFYFFHSYYDKKFCSCTPSPPHTPLHWYGI